MKVQIYTLQSVSEAKKVASLGVDHVGITPANIGLPGEITLEVGKDICTSLTETTTVAISVSNNIREIINMALFVKPDILHLCGNPGSISVNDIENLKEKIIDAGVEIMYAISVDNDQAIQAAIDYSHISDYLILDTSTEEVEGIGASGKTHDWNISRSIVENVRTPVILAGGLSIENVQDAITKVKPWGVDSLTHTNKLMDDGSFIKDFKKVEEFVNKSKEII
ncbi:MAG: phosphoribosylanthranilate isomerase [Actinomycetota bacterium]|nr:phosphoribosylanthranilate isomerase [Actinomycetota bacterium]